MEKLTKRLRSSLVENPSIEIKKSDIWSLPVLTLSVEYKRVRKSKMDILMKMMLLTFEEADIRRAANLSEMLLVEELFIEDLIKKMQRTDLIQIDKGNYRLTMKGKEQLKSGIVEEDMDLEGTDVIYSPNHDEFWLELNGSVPKTDEELTVFRYENNEDNINHNRILEVLSESKNGLDENGLQLVVADILSYEKQSVLHVPCLEFQLYHKEQDIFYSRVWNTLLGQWDHTLERQIEERELVTWREKWEMKEPISE
ncbi:hypothetical protein [Litchfieldia salsa]|uniref:Uncharacterized protein n=1 Tax=Litchfieldia salsa TaxID=930152 RepID=A0A1H0W0I8_9BACI|nr:hypothetical protein [Litchfieldia salsa]SDP83886.1 hypothetical protein SAMN05216565_108121 [Litchfieldia salsa]